MMILKSVDEMVQQAGGVGDGWELLSDRAPLKEGDGFLIPDRADLGWIDFVCRPDLFRKTREYVHGGWAWRRKL